METAANIDSSYACSKDARADRTIPMSATGMSSTRPNSYATPRSLRSRFSDVRFAASVLATDVLLVRAIVRRYASFTTAKSSEASLSKTLILPLHPKLAFGCLGMQE